MKCTYFKEQLSAYIDGELSLIAGWKIKRHLKVCSNCQKELERLGKIHRLSKLVLIMAPEPGFYERVQEKLPDDIQVPQCEKSPTLKRFWISLPQPGKIALVAAGLILLFWSFIYPQFFSPSLNIDQFEEEYLRTRETLPWMDEPALSAILTGEKRG